MTIRLSSNIIGAPHDIIVEDIDTSSPRIISNTQTTRDRVEILKNDNWIDVQRLSFLFSAQLTFPSQQFKTMARECTSTTDLPWWRMMRPEMYRHQLLEYTRVAQDILKLDHCDYYTEVYEPSRRLLDALQPAKIDISKLNSWKESTEKKYLLESFSPDNSGYAQRIEYDQFKTRTGRLVVKSGPNILTLTSKYRDIITSRWTNGRIVMLDFMSMEARIAAQLAGFEPPADIYTYLGTMLPDSTRDEIKKFVLITLYGGGTKSESDKLDIVLDQFKVKDVIQEIKDRHYDGTYLRNMYGRRILCNLDDHIIYNSFVQSTGVDVSLLGFSKIVDEMKHRQLKSVPLYVLHDALILDVYPDEIDIIDELMQVGQQIPKFSTIFPLKKVIM